VSSSIRDITERKRMEAEVRASHALAVDTARLSTLGQMAAGIAHEVNNPLAIISGLTHNLGRMLEKGECSAADAKRNTDRIADATQRIAKLVRSLRHLARDDSREDFRDLSVREVVEECLELCRERFRINSVRLTSPEIDPSLAVSSREAQIGQVLLNLLQNAFDAVMSGPGDKWVALDVTVRDDSVVIAVSDSGPGVAPELRARIMDPFFTTKPPGSGTGLGLSISKSIAEAHGGNLELKNTSGYTEFTLTLPLCRNGVPA
jgi:C4-dicarboxylate-specific signal transduction histidine kinase